MNKILRVSIIQADIHTIYLYIRRNINYFTECYYDFWTEKRANKNAYLGVDSKCRLYFLDKKDYKKKEEL